MTPQPRTSRVGLVVALLAVVALAASACTSTTLEDQGFSTSTTTTEDQDRTSDTTRRTPTTDTSRPDRDDAVVGATGAVVVTLVDAGAEPRQPLRFRLTEGTVQDLEVAMDMTMDLSGTGDAADASDANGTIPTIVMPLTAEVIDLDDRGSARIDATYLDAIVDPGATTDPDERADLEDALSMLGGSTISITQSSRGQLIYADADGFDDAFGSSGMDLTRQLADFTVPFPVEAVGVGAVWTVEQQIESDPVVLDQRATYTVTAIDGDLISVVSRVELTLAPGAGDLGADGTIEHYTVTGDGTTIIDLTSPMPHSATSTTEQSMVATAPPGSSGSLDQRTTITLTITSGP